MAVYSVDENLTPVLLLAMHTCFVSFAGLGIGRGLERAGLDLGLRLVTAGLDYSTGCHLYLLKATT